MLPKKPTKQYYNTKKTEFTELLDNANQAQINYYLDNIQYNSQELIIEKLIEYKQVLVSMTNGSTHFDIFIALHPLKVNLHPFLYQRGINSQDISVFIGIIGKSSFCFPFHNKMNHEYIAEKLFMTFGDHDIAKQIAYILNTTYNS
jgi:hypothetical protein